MEKTSIIGNLTRDPELRVTATGINVCSFTVAVNQRQTKAQKDAGQQPQAKFFRVTAWRELGENCQKYLAKGRKVYVEGRIDTQAYIGTQDGKAHASLELTADEVEFLSAKGEISDTPAGGGNAPQAAPAASPAPASVASSIPEGFTQVEEDDLPF